MDKSAGSSTAAATDVGEFVSDLDGGQFERRLSIALSAVAAAVSDHGKKGEVVLKMKFVPIPGSQQVRCVHALSFVKPTMDGKATEQEERSTVLFVGQYGALSLAQPPLFGRQGELNPK
jgi:hypothetical protein